jgi:hypothetical protein
MRRTLTALALLALSSIDASAQICAIEYTHGCAGSGISDTAYQKNNARDARYRITSTVYQDGSFYRNDTNDVEAGDRVPVGCTVYGVHSYRYQVVGCVRLSSAIKSHRGRKMCRKR